METPLQYIKFTEGHRDITQNILEDIFENVVLKESDGLEVLDVGCGPGNVTKEVIIPKLPQNFKKLIGIDKREDFIAHANRNYKDDRVEFIKMDIENDLAPEYKERFDLVTSIHCLHQLQDQQKGVDIIANWVKPGGSFILIFEFHKYLDDFFHEMSMKKKWEKYVSATGPTQDQLPELKKRFDTYLQVGGFTVISYGLKKIETPFNRILFTEYLRKNIPFRENMSESKGKQYLQYVIDNYVNEGLTPLQAQKFLTFMSKHTLMVIHAKKI